LWCAQEAANPIDAFWIAMPFDLGGKPLKALSKGDGDFGLILLLDAVTKNCWRAKIVGPAKAKSRTQHAACPRSGYRGRAKGATRG